MSESIISSSPTSVPLVLWCTCASYTRNHFTTWGWPIFFAKLLIAALEWREETWLYKSNKEGHPGQSRLVSSLVWLWILISLSSLPISLSSFLLISLLSSLLVSFLSSLLISYSPLQVLQCIICSLAIGRWDRSYWTSIQAFHAYVLASSCFSLMHVICCSVINFQK